MKVAAAMVGETEREHMCERENERWMECMAMVMTALRVAY